MLTVAKADDRNVGTATANHKRKGEKSATPLHPVFEKYLSELEDDGRAQATLWNNRRAFVLFQEWLNERGIDALGVSPDECRSFFGWLRREYAPGTVVGYLSRIRAAYRAAIERDELIADPTRRVKPPRLEVDEPRPLSKAELKAIEEACQTNREMLLILLLKFTGMRKKEVLRLAWSEIDFASDLIRLSPTRTKTRSGRFVPLHPVLKRALLDARAKHPADTYVLQTNRNGFMTDGYAHRVMTRLLDRARVVTEQPFHSFRKTFATALSEAEVPGEVIDAICGWKPSSMRLRRYTTISPERMKAAVLLAYRSS